MLWKYLSLAARQAETRPRGPALWASEATECPRKVLLARQMPEAFQAPKENLLVRRLHGFAMERALEELLPNLIHTNSKTLVEALAESPLREDLAAALPYLGSENVRPWGLLQVPFARKRDAVEVHGRVDALILFFDQLHVLEIKHTGYEGEKRVVRGGQPYPGFLVQTAFYAGELSLPAYLLVFTLHGLVREFRLEEKDGQTLLDGQPVLVGGLPPRTFAWERFAALAQATPSDFPIVELGEGLLGPAFPPDFPQHEEDNYRLALNARGKARARVQRNGREITSFRCHLCPARTLCYPGVWEEEECTSESSSSLA